MVRQTEVLSQTADADRIRELEGDPNIVIHERRTEAYDMGLLAPLHMEPSYSAMRYRTTYIYEVVKPNKKSPRQDATSAIKAGQGPKTRGDTNEFIRAFWINGKPKCRTGYSYDFNRKMCRLIK